MDFKISPQLDDLRQRTRAFVDEHVIPLESDPANYDEYENIDLAVLETVRVKARKAGLWAPQSPKEFGGMELPIIVLGGDVRGSRPLDLRSQCVQLPGARRRQHECAGESRHARAEGKMAAPDRRRQSALILRDDRAEAGRRLRSRR